MTKVHLFGDAMRNYKKIHKFVENDNLTVLKMYTSLSDSGEPLILLEISGALNFVVEGVEKINEMYPNSALFIE